MTKYEEFKNKANKCIEKAIATTDENLKKFFYNAAQGYEIKLAKLTVTEAGEEVWPILKNWNITLIHKKKWLMQLFHI